MKLCTAMTGRATACSIFDNLDNLLVIAAQGPMQGKKAFPVTPYTDEV